MDTYFLKEDIQGAKVCLKICLTSPVRAMLIKIAVRCHLAPVRMAVIKKVNNKCWPWNGIWKHVHIVCVV